MRKGFSLIEVLVTITILVMIMATLDRFFRVIILDLPRDSRLVDENIVLLNAVKNIRSDVASAKAISQEPGDSNKTSSLVIQSAAGMVSYEFENGRLVRRKTSAAKQTTPDETTWLLPHGIIEMQVRGAGRVELVTGLEYWDNGKTRRKMANSYVFFAGIPERTAQ